MELMTVTPELAAEWLGHNTHNRSLGNATVLSYSRQMKDGLWLLNGDSVRFSDQGVLLDGQHRLAAVIHSGASITMWVGRGFPLEVQATIDTQRKRTAGDALGLEGYANGNQLAAVVRMVHRWDQGERSMFGFGGSKDHLSTIEVLKVLEKDADPYEQSVKHSHMRIAPGRILSTLYVLSSRVDHTLAEIFLERFYDGASLSRGNPILTFRGYAERLSAPQGKAPAPGIYLNAGVRAWNAWIQDRSLLTIGYKGSTIPEIETRIKKESL